jgi:hypothetical protein
MSRERAASLAAVALAIVVVLIVQLRPYAGRPRPPVSYDSYYYVWRTRLLAAEGVGPARTLPPVVHANLDRPGFPAVGSLLASSIEIDPFSFMIVVRAVAALAIGAAAGAIAVGLLRHPPWSIAVMILALGTSAAVTGTAIASLENLLADVPLMAVAAAVPLAVSGRAATAATALLIAAAGVLHWVFATLFLGLIVAAWLVSRIGGDRVRQRWATGDRRAWSRVAIAAVAGLALAALLLPGLPQALPPLTGSLGNVHRLGLYQIPILLPLAIAGGVLALRHTDAPGRSALLILALWAASVPVAVALSGLLPEQLKLFRIAAFALGIPALMGLGLVVLGRIATDRGRAPGAAALAAGACAVVLAIAAAPQVGPYNDRAAAKLADRFQQARTAAAYLAAAAPQRTVVFLVDSRPWMIDRVFRAAMPASTIARMHVYVGGEADLRAGRPSSDRFTPGAEAVSRSWWTLAWPDPPAVLRADPVLIAVPAKQGAGPAGGTALGAGLSLLHGPPPPQPLRSSPARVSWPAAVGWTAAVLVVLVAVGLPWSRALFTADRLTAIALSPALGTAILAIAGTAVARTGLALGDWVGRFTLLVSLGLGVALLAFRRRSGRASADRRRGSA